MTTDNPQSTYNASYFTTTTLTCSYSCVNECSSGQRQCSGNGYQTCQTNSAGCRVWSSTTSCNDGVDCTYDSCSGAGTCQHATNDSYCEDGDPCTTNTCSLSGCSQRAAPNGTSCSDGDGCTLNDTCSGGTCRGGSPKSCTDGNPCTIDSCSGGSCVFSPTSGASCSDGNPCTLGDTCGSGECIGTPMDCDDNLECTLDQCIGGACQHLPRTGACDDGDACTRNDQCNGSFCVGAEPVPCDDATVCTTDGCNPASGCVNSPVSGPCSDGSACTLGDQCVNGVCVGGAPPDCDDDNPCTDDACNAATGCQHVANSAACDDGLSCTVSDHCVNKVCVGALPASCDDGIPCTVDSCSETEGCVHTANDAVCADSNPCTDTRCAPLEGGCVVSNNTASCDDGNPCTAGDHCDSGVCLASGPALCDDGVDCTDDSCDPGTGCVHVAQVARCDDGVACTVDACDPTVGCRHTATTSLCDDNDPCTTDGCDAVTGCANTPGALSCDDGDPCTTDSCAPGVGCQNTFNAAPCDDGDPCTVAEACSLGECVGGVPKACDDGNPCTSDRCDATTGQCLRLPVAGACNDDNACTRDDKCIEGICTGTAVLCNDGDPCTADACDPHLGCTTAPLSDVGCSDGNPCTSDDQCVNGVCSPGLMTACDDGRSCTDDACDPTTGACTHELEEGCCESDVDCPPAVGCTQSRCIGRQCQVIPGCITLEACVFGGCYPPCDPVKDATKCGDNGASLLECLRDGATGASGWITSPCSGTDRCAANLDTNRFHCCTPNCDGRECGRPSSCLISCGTCDEGFACAGPNEPLRVDSNSADAFRCVPGCLEVALEVPAEDQTWSTRIPECGPALAGTVGASSCSPCGSGKACFGGRCQDQCTIESVTVEGQCSGNTAKWCEDGVPRETNCAAEGSYCCAAGAPGNHVGQAACCSCALECELKGWECGVNSCNEPCGLPDRDDGCAEGYDCQGRRCVCTTPSRCGDAEESDEADAIADGLEVDAADVTGTEVHRGDGCGDCAGGHDPSGLLWLALVMVWLALRPRVYHHRTQAADE